jgi:DNA-binding SARP family transcriptional activator
VGERHGVQNWRLRILDRFALVGPDGTVALQPTAQRLLALLAVRNSCAERGYVAGVLWLDTSDRKAAANLRSLLWRLRQEHEALVEATHSHVRLAEGVDVDLHHSATCARALIEDRHRPDAGDIDLLAGELLPDWYDDWVIVERELLRQRRLHALEASCAGFASRGDFALALEAGLRAVAVEPLRESAHRAVVAAHLAEGNAVEALRQYEQYARLLAKELGLRPSEQMRTLVAPLVAT